MPLLAHAVVHAIIALTGVLGDPRRALPSAVTDIVPREDMVSIRAGIYLPTFPPSPAEERIAVAQFTLDRLPVTNRDFLGFVTLHPEWRRDRVRQITADAGYLAHWAGPHELGPNVAEHAPVTRVSWFAAKAYCEARGARLPTEAEWEYAASASETAPDGRKDPIWNARILAWYGKPANAALTEVGAAAANYFGVKDMHGLVWEWVLDFNSALIGSDARADGNGDKLKFCGGSAGVAKDKGDYATFMRIAMRSSLSAAYTINTLGFRCARDARPQ
jgi:formylglycine-generating enzyme required for sulfatase activity